MVVAPQSCVLVSAYNAYSCFEQALVFLERQSSQEFKAILIDDGCTDGTAEVIKPFEERDSGVQLCLHKHNGGLSSVRNDSIGHASIPLIALPDGDDAYEPDKLATHIAVFTPAPEMELCNLAYECSVLTTGDR